MNSLASEGSSGNPGWPSNISVAVSRWELVGPSGDGGTFGEMGLKMSKGFKVTLSRCLKLTARETVGPERVQSD